MLHTFADLQGLLGGLFPPQHSCSGRDVSIQMVNHIIPIQEKTKPNLNPIVDPLTTFLSEGLWAKPKSQLSEVAFGRQGRAKGLVRSGFKGEIMRSVAVVRLNTHLAQAHEGG